MLLNVMSYLRKKHIKQLLFSAFFMFLVSIVSIAQERTVTGTVTSSTDGLPLPGVNVIVAGTTIGTITDVDGNYSIDVPEDASLSFSFVGYEVKLITVGDATVVDVELDASIIGLDEVVVTSLGIQREKKQITYSAQNISADDITQARDANVTNNLQGRIAGVDIIKASSGVGSPSRIVIRGNSSIAGNNQPLFVVDGVPILNSTYGTVTSEGGGVQRGDGFSNINPDDVESMTVLKGPNAVALYGSRAANGAVVITTRKGTSRQGIGVELNTNTSIDRALILTEFQNVYGQGNGGVYIKSRNSGETRLKNQRGAAQCRR